MDIAYWSDQFDACNISIACLNIFKKKRFFFAIIPQEMSIRNFTC